MVLLVHIDWGRLSDTSEVSSRLFTIGYYILIVWIVLSDLLVGTSRQEFPPKKSAFTQSMLVSSLIQFQLVV